MENEDKLKISSLDSCTEIDKTDTNNVEANEGEFSNCELELMAMSDNVSDITDGAQGGSDFNGMVENEQTTKLKRKPQVKIKRTKKCLTSTANLILSDNETVEGEMSDAKLVDSGSSNGDDDTSLNEIVSEASQSATNLDLKSQSALNTDKSLDSGVTMDTGSIKTDYIEEKDCDSKIQDGDSNSYEDDSSNFVIYADPPYVDIEKFKKWLNENNDQEENDPYLDLDLNDDFDPGLLDIDLDDDLIDNDVAPKPLFPCSDLKSSSECQICLMDTATRDRLCCGLAVCEDCMDTYIENKVKNGCVTMSCVRDGCDNFVHRDEIIGRLEVEMKEKYQIFLANANNDPMVKTCPRCCFIHKITEADKPEEKKQQKKFGIKVVCTRCSLQWCFPCQAPWHEGMTCKEYNKGSKLLKTWAKEHSHGQINARKCPKCKVFIERRGGCDHMSCNRCGTSFCYRCGERYISLKLIGDHYGRYSPFGCKFKLLADRPVARRAVRGGVLGAKILGGVLLGGLIVVAGAVVLGTSCISLPIYGAVKYNASRKRKRFLKKLRQERKDVVINEMPMFIEMHKPSELANNDATGPFSSLEIPETIFEAESGSASTTAGSPDSGSETEVAQEVEVWVHCQHQAEQQEADALERQEKDGNVTSTAKLSKDDNDADVLNVRTSYSIRSSDLQSIKSATKDEAADKNSSLVHHKNISSLESHECENNTDAAVEKELKGEVVSGDENSTSQGCFVQFFGKKLPAVWEKDNKDTSDDSKLLTDRDPGKYNTNSLEKQHAKDSNIVLSEKLKSKKKSGKFKTQPDIVNCVLQSQQGKSIIVKPESDPDVLTDAKQFPDSDLDGNESSQIEQEYGFDDSQCVVSMETYVTRL